MQAFIDPHSTAGGPTGAATEAGETEQAKADALPVGSAGPAPATAAQASAALAAIADYYSRLEPSSPALPLVRQAHQLVGKSLVEIMTVLVPSHIDKAAFQIGTDQVFEVPVGKLKALSEVGSGNSLPAVGNGGESVDASATSPPPQYHVQARGQAVTLLDQVQQYFRRWEPSSPVPMLCQRARALAERDFMGVLRELLPKSAFKNAGADK
jgi:type VI secretion system protein ImpA